MAIDNNKTEVKIADAIDATQTAPGSVIATPPAPESMVQPSSMSPSQMLEGSKGDPTAEMLKDTEKDLKKTFSGYEGMMDKVLQYEGEDPGVRQARFGVLSALVHRTKEIFEEENKKIEAKYSDKTSEEYKNAKSALEKRMKNAPRVLEAYLGSITNGGKLNAKSLAKASEHAKQVVDLMTSSELAESGLTRAFDCVLKTGEVSNEEGWATLRKYAGDESKKQYVGTMLGLMSPADRVEFAKSYLKEKSQGDNDKKLLMDLAEIGGISQTEIIEASGGSVSLNAEESKICQEKWEKLGECKKAEEAIGYVSYGSQNIGEKFNFKNLAELLAKGAGLLNIALNAILHHQDLFNGNFKEFFGSLAPGAAMYTGGMALDEKGKLGKYLRGKSAEENKAWALGEIKSMYNRSTDGWYKFFENGKMGEPAVEAFHEYIEASKKQSGDKLKKESLSVAGFKTYLETGGKPTETKEAKKDEKSGEKKKEPVNYAANTEKYNPILKDFNTKTKEGSSTGMNDESLQNMAEIFDILKIDKSSYAGVWTEAQKTA